MRLITCRLHYTISMISIMFMSCGDPSSSSGDQKIDCETSAVAGEVESSECAVDPDSDSDECVSGSCEAPTCDDGLHNGDEVDIDCGGDCESCGEGAQCSDADDCNSQVCVMGICAAPACDDEVQNGDEAEVDCGGSCGRCDLSTLTCEQIDMIWPEEWTALEDAVLELTNAQRALGFECSSEQRFDATRPLEMEPRLRCAARRHSDDMGARDYYDHFNPEGESPGDRIDVTGYNWSQYGENIYKSPESAQEAIDGWLTSEGHCSNIMSADFSQIGIGYSEHLNIEMGRFWTQVFGAPR